MNELWVCEDCYFTHHYGRPSDDETYVPDREPLNLVDVEVSDWTDTDTGEGIHEFSWSWCEGCGSTLGGSRYRLAWSDQLKVKGA